MHNLESSPKSKRHPSYRKLEHLLLAKKEQNKTNFSLIFGGNYIGANLFHQKQVRGYKKIGKSRFPPLNSNKHIVPTK